MIAFVAAESREFSGLLRHLRNVEKIDCALRFAVAGKLREQDVTLAAHGPGPISAGVAAAALMGRGRIEALVSYGLCGALDPALAVGDVVVATEVLAESGMHLSTAHAPAAAARPFAAGKLLSMDRVACTVEEKDVLRRSGASAVEMEAAGVADQARRAGVPLYCIRVVSDGASQSFGLDFNQVRDRDGRFSRGKILTAAMRDPLRLVPELIKFGRTTRQAAETLGDFIASCRI